MNLTTTLNIIREHSPCEDSWQKALKLLGKTKADDEPLSFEWILSNLGINDAIWGLRAVSKKDEAARDKLARLFACDCAERVLKAWDKLYPADKRPEQAICIARRFANGEVGAYSKRAAASAALRAAESAAESAAWSAAESAAWNAAWSAAWNAAWSAEAEEQTKLFKKYFCTAEVVA